MPQSLRLTRRFAVAMSPDAHLRLARFSRESGLSTDAALTFVFSHFYAITDDSKLARHLARFKTKSEAYPSSDAHVEKSQ